MFLWGRFPHNYLQTYHGLVCPSATITALALATPLAATGRAKLDPRFFSILTQAGVREADMDKLGDGDCLTVEMFARIGVDDTGFTKYLKDVLGLDPLIDGVAAVPLAKLRMACDACKKRSEVEIEISAQRAANLLPPQLAIDDFPSLRLAFERSVGRTFDDHRLPSEFVMERKLGELETSLKVAS